MGAYFSRPRENLVPLAASITVATGTPIAGYDTDRLANGNPGYPFKIAETSLDLVFDFGSPAVLPELSILQHTNLTVAARLQGNGTDSWGAPAIDVPFSIPTIAADGYFSHPWIDLRDLTPQSFWRLHISGNAYPIIIGGLWLGSTLRSISDSYLYEGFAPASQGQTLVHTTAMGVELAYEQGPRREVISGSFLVDELDFAEIEGLVQSARFQARPFILVPRDDVDDAWFVRFGGDTFAKPPITPDVRLIPFPVRQVSNGLTWIDPDA